MLPVVERLEGALCANGTHDPELWTISKDAIPVEEVRRMHLAAQAICADCPAMVKCGRFALKHPELAGVWGGMLDEQRVEMRRRMQLMR